MPQPVRTFSPMPPMGGGMMPPPPGGMPPPPGPGMQAPPMAGTLPAPTQNQQQPMGASAPRRKKFGNFLENTLASYQPRPQPQPPAADQMAGMNMFASPMGGGMQRPMPRPQTPSLPRPMTGMRTPGARPLAEGGIVQGFADGGSALNAVERILVDTYGWTDNGDGTLTSKYGKRYDHDAGSTYQERLIGDAPAATTTVHSMPSGAETSGSPGVTYSGLINDTPGQSSTTSATSSTSGTTEQPRKFLNEFDEDTGTYSYGYKTGLTAAEYREEYNKRNNPDAVSSTGVTSGVSGASGISSVPDTPNIPSPQPKPEPQVSSASGSGVTSGAPQATTAQEASTYSSAPDISKALNVDTSAGAVNFSPVGQYELDEAPEGYEYIGTDVQVTPNDILRNISSEAEYNRIYDFDGDGRIDSNDALLAMQQSKDQIGDAIPSFLQDIQNYQDSSVYTDLQKQLEDLQKKATSSTQAQQELEDLENQFGNLSIFEDGGDLEGYLGNLYQQGDIDYDQFEKLRQAASLKDWAEMTGRDISELTAPIDVVDTGQGYSLLSSGERFYTDEDAYNKYVSDPNREGVATLLPMTLEERVEQLNELNTEDRQYQDMLYGEGGFFEEFENLKNQVGEYETLAGLSDSSQKAVQDMLDQIGNYEGERKELFEKAFNNYLGDYGLTVTDYQLSEIEDEETPTTIIDGEVVGGKNGNVDQYGRVIPLYNSDTQYLEYDPVTGQYIVKDRVTEGGATINEGVEVREIINEGGNGGITTDPNITVEEVYTNQGSENAVNVHAPSVTAVNTVDDQGNITTSNAYLPGVVVPRQDSFVAQNPAQASLFGPSSYRGLGFAMPEPGTDVFVSPIGQISLPSRPSSINVGQALAANPAYGSAQAIEGQNILTDIVDNMSTTDAIENLDLNLFGDQEAQDEQFLGSLSQFDLGEDLNLFAKGGAVQNYAAGGGVMEQARDASGNVVPGLFRMKYDDGSYSQAGDVLTVDRLRRAALAGEAPTNTVSEDEYLTGLSSQVLRNDDISVVDTSSSQNEQLGNDMVMITFPDGTKRQTQKALYEAASDLGVLDNMTSGDDFANWHLNDWASKVTNDPVYKAAHDTFNTNQIAYNNTLMENDPSIAQNRAAFTAQYAPESNVSSTPASSGIGSAYAGSNVPNINFASNASPGMASMFGRTGSVNSLNIPAGSTSSIAASSLYGTPGVSSLNVNNPETSYASEIDLNSGIGSLSDRLKLLAEETSSQNPGFGGGLYAKGGLVQYMANGGGARDADMDPFADTTDRVTAEELASGDVVSFPTDDGGSITVDPDSDIARMLTEFPDQAEKLATITTDFTNPIIRHGMGRGLGPSQAGLATGMKLPSVTNINAGKTVGGLTPTMPRPDVDDGSGVASPPDIFSTPVEGKTTPMSIKDQVDVMSIDGKSIEEIAEATGLSEFEVSEIIADLNAGNVQDAINLQNKVAPQTTTAAATPADVPAPEADTPAPEETLSDKVNAGAEAFLKRLISGASLGLIDPEKLNLSGPPTEGALEAQRRMMEGSGSQDGESNINVNYTLQNGVPICNEDGYIYDPVAGMCIPAEASSSPIQIMPNQKQSIGKMPKGIGSGPTVKALPMNRGGSVGLNRAADDYLKALAG